MTLSQPGEIVRPARSWRDGFDSEAEIAADVAADRAGFGRATERHGTDVGQVGTVAEPVPDVVFGLDVGSAAVL